MSRAVVVDVTQFAHEPAASGVQRVLGEMLRGFSSAAFSVRCLATIDGEAHLLDPLIVANAIDRIFAGSYPPGARLRAELLAELRVRATDVVSEERLTCISQAYLIPEPTYRRDVLHRLEGMRVAGVPTGAFLHDTLPVFSPELFPGRHQMETDRYFFALAGLEHVATTSAAGMKDLTRLGQRPVVHGTIAVPGARRADPAQPVDLDLFVCVGTVEPRKRMPVVLEAFRQLWAEGGQQRLAVVGSAGWESEVFLHELACLAATHPWVHWLRDADDFELTELVARSAAVVYVSEQEGFGLPPLEALAVGTPVISSARIPALDAIGPDGQIRLGQVTAASVAAAVRSLTDPTTNAELRAAAGVVRLPSWVDFHRSLHAWVQAFSQGTSRICSPP